ncbi:MULTISPECIES: DNA cytosine methyltransferase [Pseudomonas]|uniref:DNA cytosine methyltransferase n=1 Tax=Pseudomonas TaxID=286 RepID=UPI00065462E9|nr:DNA (cytosine-5-)-methyltransferase [Pseudomonas lundensis]KMM91946.1 cytosine methyltransferase [Pseudomonas lundensis]
MPDITYGSVCSGIEAATQAWHPLGMRAAWFAEIEPFPSAVLAHHYPDVPNLGDMTKLAALVLTGKITAPDVLVGGTPCQAFSVAGIREGLTDPRGALTIKYVELADAVDYVRASQRKPASVIVWENVPGVLSDKGNAFGCFLGALAGEDCELHPSGKRWTDAGCVYGPKRAIAWRILDAQHFGLAQRRRRVFVVASAREGFDPTSVLFERDGLRRDSPPRRGEIKAVAALTANGVGTCGADDNQAQAGHLIAGTLNANGKAAGSATQQDAEAGLLVVHGTQDPGTSEHLAFALGRNNGQENAVLAFTCKDYGADAGPIAPTLRAMNHSGSHANAGGQVAVCVTGEITHTLKAEGFDGSEDGTGRGQPIVTHAIQAGALRTNPASGPDGVGVQADHAYTLEARAEVQAVQSGSAVRRLTPTECERLQGFPDDHTLIPWRNKPADECPDGPRYKAIGNSKAVTVVRWIGRRLLQQL